MKKIILRIICTFLSLAQNERSPRMKRTKKFLLLKNMKKILSLPLLIFQSVLSAQRKKNSSEKNWDVCLSVWMCMCTNICLVLFVGFNVCVYDLYFFRFATSIFFLHSQYIFFRFYGVTPQVLILPYGFFY